MTDDSRPAHAPTCNEWVQQFAHELGIAPPTDEEMNDLLAIAGVAAHTSERTAAPLSTWLVGRAGAPPADAKAAAQRLAERFDPPT